MALTIKNVRTICTSPQGLNLVTVKIETSEPGLYGVGCATFTQRHKAVATAVEEYLKLLLIGKDPRRSEDIWQTLAGSSYWRNGPVLNNAMSGVDMALWDIKGKLANMPLYQLFGGKCREAALAYTHSMGKDISSLIDNVEVLVGKGYKNVRVHVGAYGGDAPKLHSPEGALPGAYFDPKPYMRTTVDMFDKLRSHFGYELGLCHDVHERLAPNDAMNLAKDLEKYKLLFLEDALPPEQLSWFEHIRANCTTPLAMGELFNNPHEWIDIVSRRLIDYIRVHISQIGGITPALKLIKFCDVYGIRTAWHGPPDLTPIGHAVNAHLDLASPNFGIQEWVDNDHHLSSGDSEIMREIFPGMPECRDGYIYVNDKPGIGVDINEEKAQEYADGNPNMPSRNMTDWLLTRLPDGTAVRP